MRVLVVSEHWLLGQSFATVLRGMSVDEVIETSVCTAADAVQHAREWPADVIVIEGIVSFSAAISIIRGSCEALGDASILLIGADDDVASAHLAIHAGATGYLHRDTSPATLAATLRGMARGELGLSRVVALAVMQQLRRTALTAQVDSVPNTLLYARLTQREREVFALVRHGKRSREIAEDLCIAEGTVYKHIQNILSKLHVHNRAHAVVAIETHSEAYECSTSPSASFDPLVKPSL